MSNPKTIFTGLFAALLASLLLAGCGAGPSASSKPVEVQVTLSEFKFESSRTSFKAGVTYHFVVTNKGVLPHEIMLMRPTEVHEGMHMEEMHQVALAHIEEEDLPAGGTAAFDYMFAEPAASGLLEFACHTPGHYEAGMKLPITVAGN